MVHLRRPDLQHPLVILASTINLTQEVHAKWAPTEAEAEEDDQENQQKIALFEPQFHRSI